MQAETAGIQRLSGWIAKNWVLTGPHEIPGHWVSSLDPNTGKVDVVHNYRAMPNGIVFSPDEQRIYIADTGGHKRHPGAKHPDEAAK